jgi:hypothetical protein
MEMSGQLHASAALPLGKEHSVPIGQEVGWTSESVWTTWIRENSLPYRDSNFNLSVVQRYTDYATPADLSGVTK